MKRARLLASVLIMLAIPGIVSAARLTAGATYADVVRSDSPSGYWRLGEDLGATDAADASAHGHTGAYGWRVTSGVAGAPASDSDSATRFPGVAPDGSRTGSDVSVPTAADLNFGTGDFTVEAWVRTDVVSVTTNLSDAGGERAIVGKSIGLSAPCRNARPGSPREVTWPGWAMSITDDSGEAGRIRAVVSYNVDSDEFACPTVKRVVAYGPDIRVDDGAWHYVAAVFRRSSGITVYVDGVATPTDGSWTPSISNSAPLTIGSVSGIFPFSGDIDEPAVYDHALSADRLEAHRQAGITPAPAEPITPAADGTDTPGIVQLSGSTSSWALSNTLDANVKQSFTSFCCGQAVIGDWDGDGIDSDAFFEAGHWKFNDGYDDYVDLSLDFGQPGDVAVAGDWDGDGIDTPGVRRGSTWYLSDTFGGSIDHVVDFGNATDMPVVGDWDGDGRDGIGVFDGTTWQLSNTLDSAVSTTVTFGQPGDTPVAGDWNGDGRDTIGARRGSTWYLSDGLSGSVDHQFDFGAARDTPVIGDWDNDVIDDTEKLDDATASARSLSASADAPPPIVRQLAPVVWLNESYAGDDWHNPAYAFLYFIRRSPLKWYAPGSSTLIRGRGRVRPFLLGAAAGRGAYKYVVTRNGQEFVDPKTYWAWDFTRPQDSSQDRRGLSPFNGFYLDLGNSDHNGVRNANDVPVYYDYLPGRWIRYWFFYAYDIGGLGFNHEGDWEGVTIHLDPSNKPIEIRLDRHKSSCAETKKWNDMTFDAGHVVVYAANGSHGTYSSSGSDFINRCHPLRNDTRAQGYKWLTWSYLGSVRKQNWYGFGGAWGEIGNEGSDTTGPLGPSRWKLGAPTDW